MTTSKEMERFLGELNQNSEWQASLEGMTDVEDVVSQAMKLGSANGYAISPDDIRSRLDERALSENELANVTGGATGPSRLW